MIRQGYAAARLLLLLLLVPVAGTAQDNAVEEVSPPELTVDAVGAPAVAEQLTDPQEPVPDPLIAEFEQLAQRAEDLASNPDASLFSINRLRAELVEWRDVFLAQGDVNAARIATVNAQIAALGPVPEDGEEAEAVAARRAELNTQRLNLIAPQLLAEERQARAAGLIGEFDARVLQRETEALFSRGPIPLNPTFIAGGIAAITELVALLASEARAGFSGLVGSGRLQRVLPNAMIYLIGGLLLISFGRSLITRWREELSRKEGHLVPLMRLVVSFVQILVPLIGIYIFTRGLGVLSIFGVRGADLIAALPAAGFCVIFGWWVSRHIFPREQSMGYLGYDAETRAKGRRYTIAIAWFFAIAVLIHTGIRTLDLDEGVRAAIEFPGIVLVSIMLWRLAQAIKSQPEHEEANATDQAPHRTRRLVARYGTFVAVLSPLLAVVGYGFAGYELITSSVQSLGLIAVLFLLQRITQDLLERPSQDDDNRGLRALLPVFITFILFVFSAPIFALIWGARVDDLIELWARFREGFAIGETRLSPTDFLTFVFVFALGYILTRFIQSTLRKSVLPRTRFDLGAQNAVVAGFGYVGIILAAMIAITSAGIDLTSLAFVAGALSVGIGFGLQNIVSNFVSGIILLIERPVSEGDWIEVGGQMGYVRAISVRSTRIETFDRTDVIIPNADLVSGQVTNWTRGNLVGRVIVPVGVAYGTDVDKVTEILKGIAERHPLVVMDPPPAVLFQGFGADSLDFEIRAILRDVNYVLVTKSEMNHEIAKEFAKAGIEIPFAQRDLWLRNPEVLRDQTA